MWSAWGRRRYQSEGENGPGNSTEMSYSAWTKGLAKNQTLKGNGGILVKKGQNRLQVKSCGQFTSHPGKWPPPCTESWETRALSFPESQTFASVLNIRTADMATVAAGSRCRASRPGWKSTLSIHHWHIQGKAKKTWAGEHRKTTFLSYIPLFS